MSKRISDLTAKGANLDTTDLLEISESDGLGGYVSKSITGAEIIAAGANLGNTDLTQTLADAVRLYDINGNILQFDNGQFVVGTQLASNYALEVSNSAFAGGGLFYASGLCLRGISSTGLGGQFEGVSGMSAYSSSGNAVHGISISGGLGGKFEGGAYVETYGFGGSAEASAVFEAASTTKGALIPRMTTTQRDAISSPATGLEIFNTTTNRKEYYNGTYWQGKQQTIGIGHLEWSPSDSSTAIFSNSMTTPQVAGATFAAFDIELRGAGVIRACTFNSWASGTAGSNESWSLYVRINSTDYLVQTLTSSAAIRQFENTALNIPYVDGDVLRMVFVNPAWVTNPTLVVGGGILTLR